MSEASTKRRKRTGKRRAKKTVGLKRQGGAKKRGQRASKRVGLRREQKKPTARRKRVAPRQRPQVPISPAKPQERAPRPESRGSSPAPGASASATPAALPESAARPGARSYQGLIAPAALALLALLVAWLGAPGDSPATEAGPAAGPAEIRVLLEAEHELALQLADGWRLADGTPLPAIARVEVARPSSGREVGLSAGGRLLASGPELQLETDRGELGVSVDELSARARRLVLTPGKRGRLRAVLHVGLETYTEQVLGSEMPLGWHDEALKAQSVAVRTYAWSTRHPERDFDVFADTRSQVFGGEAGPYAERARALVAATRGVLLATGGEPFVSYFHSTCGGDTVPAHWTFPWVRDQPPESWPPSGASDCPCRELAPRAEWTERVSLQPVADEQGWRLPLRSFELSHRERGGYVRLITVVDDAGRRRTLDPFDFRAQAGGGKVMSYAFAARLEPSGQTAQLAGRGWGHGVGLCQWGARGQAEQGRGWREILTHYYPGAELIRVDLAPDS